MSGSDYDDQDPNRSYDGRTPPQNVEAERGVLGAMLISKDAIADVLESGLQSRDFYRPNHETIYDAILDLYGRSEPVDMITVADLLLKAQTLAKVGGAAYVHDLSAAVPIAANASYYAGLVREAAMKRRLVDAGVRIVQHGYSTAAVQQSLDAAQMELLDAMPTTHASELVRADAIMTEVLDQIDAASAGVESRGVPTGFLDLDDLTGGWQDGQMVVIAGRPGMGKSTLALDCVRSAAIRHGLPSVIFSLEMTRQEIGTRLVSAEAKVPLSNLRSGEVDDGHWARMALALNPVSAAPLYVDDSASLTMTEIRAKARRLHQHLDGGLRLIVIDYMQLMSSGKSVESRQLEVSEFSRQIKLLAKELRCPILALSQLNRGPEQRTSKRPALSDLRESGSIEQDADIVVLMHREDAYDPESSRPGEADFIVAKHRNGPVRDIAVAAQLHYSRFTDLARV